MGFSSNLHIYVADAGAGKTTTLMNLVTEEAKTTPVSRIAFVTFTKMGAVVAQQRVKQAFPDLKDEDFVHFSTIHSMCFRATGCRMEQTMDIEKYTDFGKKAGFSFNFMQKRTLDETNWDNLTDTQLIALEQLYRNNSTMARKKILNTDTLRFELYCKEYVKYKNTFGYIDFTDMLEKYIRDNMVEDVDVAFIDEAQDCSPLQWQVMQRAFSKCRAVYIAGDPKQSIYGFQGAEPGIMTSYRGTIHQLDVSYRVPSKINEFVRERIVKQMDDVPETPLLSAREGGTVSFMSNLREFKQMYREDKTYMILIRSHRFKSMVLQQLADLGMCYTYCNQPCWTATERNKAWLYFNGSPSAQDWWDKLPTYRKELFTNAHAMGKLYFDNRRETFNIRVDTIHGVKGDEADVVLVYPDLSPMSYREYRKDPRDAHKLFYVACTRAKEQLIVMGSLTNTYYGELV